MGLCLAALNILTGNHNYKPALLLKWEQFSLNAIHVQNPSNDQVDHAGAHGIIGLTFFVKTALFLEGYYGKTNLEGAQIDCVMNVCEEVMECAAPIYRYQGPGAFDKERFMVDVSKKGAVFTSFRPKLMHPGRVPLAS